VLKVLAPVHEIPDLPR